MTGLRSGLPGCGNRRAAGTPPGHDRYMFFTAPSGPALTVDHAQQLDDEFFQSLPLEYFHARIASLISGTDASDNSSPLAGAFAEALGVDDPSDVLSSSAPSRELQIAIDSFAMRHHAAEALVRLYHALTVTADPDDPAACVWARIADGPYKTANLVKESRSHLRENHDSFWSLVLRPTDITASELDKFNKALNVMASWFQYAMHLLVRDDVDLNAAHTKVKHGLAVRPRHDLMSFVTEPLQPGAVPLSALTGPSAIDIFAGPSLDSLARPSKINGRAQGLEITRLNLNSATLLVEIWMITTTYGAMFHIAAARHFSRRDVEIAAYPPLPLGPTPNELLPDSMAVGLRQPLTTPPDGGEPDRTTTISNQRGYQELHIDHSGKWSGTVTEG